MLDSLEDTHVHTPTHMNFTSILLVHRQELVAVDTVSAAQNGEAMVSATTHRFS